MGEYFREEIKDQLDTDIYFNMTEEEADAVYSVQDVFGGRILEDVFSLNPHRNVNGHNFASMSPGFAIG